MKTILAAILFAVSGAQAIDPVLFDAIIEQQMSEYRQERKLEEIAREIRKLRDEQGEAEVKCYNQGNPYIPMVQGLTPANRAR